MGTFSPKSLAGTVAAVALAGAFTTLGGAPSFATGPVPVYAGGGTLAEYVYRDLFNCWSSASATAPTLGGTSCAGGVNSVAPNLGEALYAPVGTGGGQDAYLADNPSLLGTPDSDIAYTSGDFPAYPYPTLTFAAGDFPLTTAQTATLDAAALGPALQLPTLLTTVAIPFNAAGLSPTNPLPMGGTSGLDLSRDNLCGIFSGAITDWSDSRLAADNGGTPLSSSPLTIKVVYRHEGNGTTLLLSNALITQCAGSAHPMPTAWGAASTIYFVHNAASLPANFVDDSTLEGGALGTGAEADAVAATGGAIGYVSPDYAQPFGVTGHSASATANLQNQASVTAGIKTFIPPTVASAAAIMANNAPPAAGANAAAWAAAGVQPNPTAATAYPIGGFTWLYPYSCYSDVTVVDTLLTGTTGLFKWIWGTDPAVATVIETHGFAPLPSAWRTAANSAAFRDAATKIRRGGGANHAFCSTGA